MNEEYILNDSTLSENQEEEMLVLDNYEILLDETKKEDFVIGLITDCKKLNIRKEPNVKSEVLCVIDYNSEVIVDDKLSTSDFYAICTSSGIEGFCVRKFVTIQP